MSIKTLRGLLCAAALVLARTAAAEVVTFEFCGHTTISNSMAREGTPVVGHFSWNTAAPVTFPYPGSLSSNYAPPDTGSISFSVGRHSITTDQTGVTVRNDTGSNVGDMIDINGMWPVIDGTLFHQGYFSIRLASASGNTSVFQDTRLPSELDIAQFDSVGMNYFQMFSGVTPNDVILDVNLKWIRQAGDSQPGQSVRRLCLPRDGA